VDGAGCTSAATNEGATTGPESGETRSIGSTQPFDNVSDYHNLNTAINIAGGGSATYQANVSVVPAVLHGVGTAAADSAALLITVSVAVTGANETVQLQAYRLRHSPNSLP
jgi:hypothetical protein